VNYNSYYYRYYKMNEVITQPPDKATSVDKVQALNNASDGS
jgi:hypothetical protein